MCLCVCVWWGERAKSRHGTEKEPWDGQTAGTRGRGLSKLSRQWMPSVGAPGPGPLPPLSVPIAHIGLAAACRRTQRRWVRLSQAAGWLLAWQQECTSDQDLGPRRPWGKAGGFPKSALSSSRAPSLPALTWAPGQLDQRLMGDTSGPRHSPLPCGGRGRGGRMSET